MSSRAAVPTGVVCCRAGVRAGAVDRAGRAAQFLDCYVGALALQVLARGSAPRLWIVNTLLQQLIMSLASLTAVLPDRCQVAVASCSAAVELIPRDGFLVHVNLQRGRDCELEIWVVCAATVSEALFSCLGHATGATLLSHQFVNLAIGSQHSARRLLCAVFVQLDAGILMVHAGRPGDSCRCTIVERLAGDSRRCTIGSYRCTTYRCTTNAEKTSHDVRLPDLMVRATGARRGFASDWTVLRHV
mmetsp:Transcript_80554/g.228210  ORF Transcript_80554/g.228210 Transcript_80554/m.228210 type:complete len:245 (-) Transcript_80554:2073-2807(-)